MPIFSFTLTPGMWPALQAGDRIIPCADGTSEAENKTRGPFGSSK